MKVPFTDFIQNMSKAPSKSCDYLKNPSQDFKNYESLAKQEGTIRVSLFF